jgi:hypothetical protein
MPVELIGLIAAKDGSEALATPGPVIDRDFTRRFATAHEDAGFDKVLIGYSAGSPDNIQVASYAATRYFATLDHFSNGRTILRATEELAHRILADTKVSIDRAGGLFKQFRRFGMDRAPENVSSQRLLAAAPVGA